MQGLVEIKLESGNIMMVPKDLLCSVSPVLAAQREASSTKGSAHMSMDEGIEYVVDAFRDWLATGRISRSSLDSCKM